MRKLKQLILGATLIGCFVFVCVYLYAGQFGINVLLRRGGTTWTSVAKDDLRLSNSMRVAQSSPSPATAGLFTMREIGPGFEIGELQVLVGQAEVDRILLVRVDSTRFKILVKHSDAGDKNIDSWMKDLGAVAVINGSYYGRRGEPETPILEAGAMFGPTSYDASHGALVVRDSRAEIVDLRSKTWKDAFVGAHDGLVSYPLLVGQNTPLPPETRWLANRSFVAQDHQGKIIFGTTQEGFFSLNRLAAFLQNGPLDLATALGLDGGPLACQAVSFNGFHRNYCGSWELQASENDFQLLQPLFGNRRWALPIVIAVMAQQHEAYCRTSGVQPISDLRVVTICLTDVFPLIDPHSNSK